MADITLSTLSGLIPSVTSMKWILSLLPFCTSHLAWRGSCLPVWRGRPFLTGYPLSPTHPISLPEPALPLLQRASENKRGLFCLGTPHLLRLKAHQPPTDAPRRSSPETPRAMLPPAPITAAQRGGCRHMEALCCPLPAAGRYKGAPWEETCKPP